MRNYRFIILGAGPSGLTFAHSLLKRGETSFVVLEKEEVPGGLCRSREVDGHPLDIGGGHFLDVKNQEVLDFLFEFMPRLEWREHVRVSKISLKGTLVDYPLEANLWQLPPDMQLDYLEAIAQAGCVRGEPMPEGFEEWILWKLGERIAEDYMLPYNRKIWSRDLSDLGTYWLYKLPDVSFRDTLRSCLEKAPSGSMPAHGRFFYPERHGYGELWKRMGAALGDRLLRSTPLKSLDVENLLVNGDLKGERIVSTVPWQALRSTAVLPEEISRAIDELDYASVAVDYYRSNHESDAHWVYDPDEGAAHHRVLCRHNFLPGSRGCWTERNTRRPSSGSSWQYVNEYAYPLNTLNKPAAVKVVTTWAESKGITGLGRWGTWEHMNSDVAVAEAMKLAGKFGKSEGS